MPVLSKIVTVREVIDNIVKNGLPQTFGQFWRDDKGHSVDSYQPRARVVSACAVGMAAYNLEIPYSALREVLPHTRAIEGWNDQDKLSFEQIAAEYKDRYSDELDKEITVYWIEP